MSLKPSIENSEFASAESATSIWLRRQWQKGHATQLGHGAWDVQTFGIGQVLNQSQLLAILAERGIIRQHDNGWWRIER